MVFLLAMALGLVGGLVAGGGAQAKSRTITLSGLGLILGALMLVLP